MREYYKKQCLAALKTLEEAHKTLSGFVEKNQREQAAEILELCQKIAVNVGEMIESSEGEDAEEVRILEEYCELAYQFHEQVLGGDALQGRKAAKKLDRPIIKVTNGVNNRIPTQREVVFLPYKASMWDSLESVWRQLSTEPNTTALVMPIPYYDRNPGGSFGTFHYEGSQFPADVPVVRYDQYDIAARHPEAIYIHNPYDNDNLVTTVHPDYYSSKLKNFTDELVYIPYFVFADISRDDQATINACAHLITVPAVMNANRVIVQSENWRQGYVDVLTRQTGEEYRPYWDKKIEARISPKLDRVLHPRESDFVIPEAWRRIVEKPNGERKKVVFYNTTLSAMLVQNEKMLDQIEKTLAEYRAQSAEVALLWRPHPLMEATLDSMRPHLSARYKAIVSEYRREGWGIYDDTPDFHCAFAISDCYYGDVSSLLFLYQKTGKPTQVQSV